MNQYESDEEKHTDLDSEANDPLDTLRAYLDERADTEQRPFDGFPFQPVTDRDDLAEAAFLLLDYEDERLTDDDREDLVTLAYTIADMREGINGERDQARSLARSGEVRA